MFEWLWRLMQNLNKNWLVNRCESTESLFLKYKKISNKAVEIGGFL